MSATKERARFLPGLKAEVSARKTDETPPELRSELAGHRARSDSGIAVCAAGLSGRARIVRLEYLHLRCDLLYRKVLLSLLLYQAHIRDRPY
jgi:hypothetical protein